MTGSALSTTIVYAFSFAPYIVLSFVGGVAADRFDRRRVLIAGDLCSAGIWVEA